MEHRRQERGRSTGVYALLTASTALACLADPFPITARGERVELGADFDVGICAGTVERLDRHAQRVEAAFGLDSAGLDRHRLYAVDDQDFRDEFCSRPKSGGCYDPGDRAAVVNPELFWWRSSGHEVVHSVAHMAGVTATLDFFEEGLATYWGDGYCIPPGRYKLDELLAPRPDLSRPKYEFAARVVDHVIDKLGLQALLELMDRLGEDEPLACTRELLEEAGRSLPALEEAGGRAIYRPDPMWCDFEAVVVPVEDTVQIDLPLACADPEVYNTFSRAPGEDPPLARSVVLEFPEDNYYKAPYLIQVLAPDETLVEISTCDCPVEILHKVEGQGGLFELFYPGRFRLEAFGHEGDEISVLVTSSYNPPGQ